MARFQCWPPIAYYSHMSLRAKSRVYFCLSCKEYRNLNSFFAIVMGMSNPAVSRLNQTWEVGVNLKHLLQIIEISSVC